MSIEITDWLRELGLEQYAPAFRENAIDARVLPSLTAEDLKDLGVTLVGHRRRLLDAIAALGTDVPAAIVPATSGDAPAPPDAERRQLTVMFCDRRLHLALDAVRPGGSAGADRCLSPRGRRGRRGVRRLCREVHGRRCAGLFRLPASP